MKNFATDKREVRACGGTSILIDDVALQKPLLLGVWERPQDEILHNLCPDVSTVEHVIVCQ